MSVGPPRERGKELSRPVVSPLPPKRTGLRLAEDRREDTHARARQLLRLTQLLSQGATLAFVNLILTDLYPKLLTL